jgi:hypothetical protein
MNSISRRLREPSTYAGIAACLAGFNILGLTQQEWDQILGALVSLAGMLAIFLKERPVSAKTIRETARLDGACDCRCHESVRQ